MLSFKQYLSESIVNILPDSHDLREKHADELYHLVHKAYQKIGGIKGSGFGSPTDMKHNIPMIKFHRSNDKIKAAMFYKNSGGRKRVAIATDSTPEGKTALGKMMRDDLKHKRAFSEQSGGSLAFLHKHMHAEDVKGFAIHPYKVKTLMPENEIRAVPHDDPEVAAHPHLKDHFYQRQIGGEWKTKVALGTPEVHIK